MSELLYFIVWFVFEFLLESLAWGTLGFLLLRFIRKDFNRWYLEVIGLSLAFLGRQLITFSILDYLDITVGNTEVLQYFDIEQDEMFQMTAFDCFIGIAQVFGGYWVGYRLFRMGVITGRH